MKKENTITWETQLTTAFETFPFSPIISGNALIVMKPDLIKSGIRDFPVFTLTGKPGSGKTTIARTCTCSSTKEYSFTAKVSATKKELQAIPSEYVLLDDLASFTSHSAREKAHTFLDEIVRLSYSGNMPLMVITAEDQALTRITPSCRERLLEIPVNDVFEEDNLTAILDYLSNKKDMLDEIFNEFAEWYKDNGQKYNYINTLQNIRKHYKGKNPRSISMFFICYISTYVFCDFVSAVYQIDILIDKIIKNYEKLWQEREISTLKREDLVIEMFQALISENVFSPVKPMESELCENLCNGYCSYCAESENGYCTLEHNKPPFGYYYNPKDLMLNIEPTSVVLIENAKYFYQFPKYCDTTTPLMIIRADALLSLMNSELHKFCTER